ncbi:hypothetical protein [Geodermatophilus nigrescens]|uniref:Asp23 family, cell envelope-related function n=1 Tax=Geodermatophilus nigrescens TaxID=1070870 RepID=A0A1M5RSP0_9ACTN|nr:hypothetical protein [Geodermatophilus nigrescens]SHH28813.1 hypothetical protein SAMN05444351_4460 [Geodermatophilus nigrescens]
MALTDAGGAPPPDDPLSAATRAARAEDAALQAPPALVERVMAVVRAEPRVPGALVLSAEPGARVEVSERTVTRLLLAAVDELGDVRAGTCRAAVADGELRVALTVAARAGQSLPPLVEAVRTRVTGVAEAAFGLPVAAVDVEVDDLF